MHEHAHQGQPQEGTPGGVLGVACIILIGLAALELTVGSSVHAGIITADGGHNLGDSLTILAGGLVVNWLCQKYRHLHLFDHNLRNLADAGVYALTISLVALGAFETMHHHGTSNVLKVAFGLVSWLVNFSLARLVDGYGRPQDKAFALEMRADSWVSLGLVAAGGCDWLIGRFNWDLIFACGILAFVLYHLGHEMLESLGKVHAKRADC